METLVALSIFMVVVVVTDFWVIDASISFRQTNERTQVVLLAKERLGTSHSIRDADFDDLRYWFF